MVSAFQFSFQLYNQHVITLCWSSESGTCYFYLLNFNIADKAPKLLSYIKFSLVITLAQDYIPIMQMQRRLSKNCTKAKDVAETS